MEETKSLTQDEIKNLLMQKRKEQVEIASDKINEILKEYNVKLDATAILKANQVKIMIEVIPNE